MKKQKTTQFNVGHKKAFTELGAIAKAGWSAFNIKKKPGKMPTLLVTTLWNFHRAAEDDAPRHAIWKNSSNDTYWYKVFKPYDGDDLKKISKSKHPKDHWNSINLALTNSASIAIVGFLKDRYSLRCSLSNIFDCGPLHYRETDGSIWLQIHPRGEVGCDVGMFDREELRGQTSLAEVQKIFEDELIEVSKLSAEARAIRRAEFDGIPKEITVTTKVRTRKALVVYDVLEAAKGACKKCGNKAPFTRRSDGSPYLEVHHCIPLAKGGLDLVENAEALCPNCHREKHFGETDA